MASYHNPYSNSYASSSSASASSSSHYRPPHDPRYHPPTLYPLQSISSGSSVASSSRPPPPQRLPSNMDGLLDNTDSEISAPPPLTSDPNFDIIDWYPAYQSCQKYFLDHAQHEPGTQALCALVNIRLPFQWHTNPVTSSVPPGANGSTPSSAHSNSQFTFTPGTYQRTNGLSNNQPSHHAQQSQGANFISLIPYIRRLIITGFDKPPILHGFFGDSYKAGIAPHLDCERRNYLFAAKHGGWRTCKKSYDAGSCGRGDETAPFMKPLEDASSEELEAAEKAWGKWLAMEDWMVGERGLVDDGSVPSGSQGSARERENLSGRNR